MENEPVKLGDNGLEENQKNRPIWVVFLLLTVFGLINAVISPYLYTIIGSLIFHGENILVLLLPIFILGTGVPFFYLLFILVESLLVSWLSLFLVYRARKTNSSQRKFFHVLIIFIIYALLQLGVQIVPQMINQAAIEKQNQIAIGEKHYDFSTVAEINNDNNVKYNVVIKNNNIAWGEQTKTTSAFPENVWNVFLFKFDPEQGTGTTIQVSDFDKAENKSPGILNSILLDDQVYWVQDEALYTYNNRTQQSELIASGISSIYGKYKNSILVKETDGRLYFLDLTSKKITDFLFNGSSTNYSFSVSDMNDKYLCYTTQTSENGSMGTYKVGRYDMETGENISFDSNRSSSISNIRNYPMITDCQKDYIVFAQATQGPLKSNSTYQLDFAYKVYDVNKSEYILEKVMNAEELGNNDANARVYNNKLYYTNSENNKNWLDNYSLKSIDLTTKNEDLVLQNVYDWDINGDYIVYGVKSDYEDMGYTKEIFLKKLSTN